MEFGSLQSHIISGQRWSFILAQNSDYRIILPQIYSIMSSLICVLNPIYSTLTVQYNT